MAILGLYGGPLAAATATAVLFAAYDQTSTASSLLTVPRSRVGSCRSASTSSSRVL
jgi:hypothetical protein